MLLVVSALPVALCNSAIALLRSVCERSSFPRAVVNAVWRSSTRKTVDCIAQLAGRSGEWICAAAGCACYTDHPVSSDEIDSRLSLFAKILLIDLIDLADNIRLL